MLCVITGEMILIALYVYSELQSEFTYKVTKLFFYEIWLVALTGFNNLDEFIKAGC